MTDQRNIPSTTRERKGLHPKRFLKELQQKFRDWQYSYLLFCFLVPVILIALAYIILYIYLVISDPFDPPYYTGGPTPIVLDLNAQYMYFFEGLRDAVHGDGSLLYSFGRSLGGEFMGIYAYYLASPLSYIVALFPKEHIQEAVFTILLIKTGLSGATFGFYLHKRSKNPRKLSIFIFSMLYALCAYGVVHQNNTMWIDALVWLPLFVYSLENLITRRKYKLYVISLSAILISNYYIGYMVCIFSVLYFCYYYFSKPPQEINPRGERFHFLRTGARFGAFSLISALISAFMLIAAYYSLSFGKTAFSNPSWSLEPKFDILDFLVKLLPGSFDTVEPIGLPFIYCGILTLILIPIYFTLKKISLREKLASGALIAVFLISFIVNPIDLIWHGFSAPNWLNGRYSFIFCFILLVLAYKAFCNLKAVSDKFILGICGFLLLFVAVAEKFEMQSFINANKTFNFNGSIISGKMLWSIGCIWVSVFFIVLLGVLLCSKIRLKKRKKKRSAVTAIIAAVVSAELLLNSVVCFLWFDEDVMFSSYDSYQDHLNELRPVVSQVTDLDKGFYRMEKTYHRTNNDNMALGLKGITSSTSTLNQKAIDFIDYMGYNGRGHLTYYNGGTPFADSLLGIKYVIDTEGSKRFDNSYDELEQIKSESYNVYKNPYALSLAYGVNSAINRFEMVDKNGKATHSTFFSRYNDLAQAMLGSSSEENIFRSVHLVETIPLDCEEKTLSGLRKQYTAGSETEGAIIFSYVATYSGDYYFYVPVSTSNPIKASFERNTETVYERIEFFGNNSDHILHAGTYEKGDRILITLEFPKESSISFRQDIPYLWNLDAEAYNSCMTRLINGPQFKIDSDSVDDHLTGTISTAVKDQMILTTIPFDEGWTVYVDGKEVKTYETLGALMAFDIQTSGDHTLEMKYFPDCYKLGLIFSVAGISIFVLLCAAEFVLKRTVLKNRIPTYPDEYWVLEDCEVEAPPALEKACDDAPVQSEETASPCQENPTESTEDTAESSDTEN